MISFRHGDVQAAPREIQKSSGVLRLIPATCTCSCTGRQTHTGLSLETTTTCCFTFPDLSSKVFSIRHPHLTSEILNLKACFPPSPCVSLRLSLSFCLSFNLYSPLPLILVFNSFLIRQTTVVSN